MVLVFSSHANNSQQIPREVAYAVSAKVAIIQLRIEDVEPNDNLGYFLETSQWLDAFAPRSHSISRVSPRPSKSPWSNPERLPIPFCWRRRDGV